MEPLISSPTSPVEARPIVRGAADGAGLGKTPEAMDDRRGRSRGPRGASARSGRTSGAAHAEVGDDGREAIPTPHESLETSLRASAPCGEVPPARRTVVGARSDSPRRARREPLAPARERSHVWPSGRRRRVEGTSGHGPHPRSPRTPRLRTTVKSSPRRAAAGSSRCRASARHGSVEGVVRRLAHRTVFGRSRWVETRARASAPRVGRPRSAPGTGSPGEHRAIPTCNMVVGRHGLRRGARPRGRAGRRRPVNGEGARARSDAGEATAEGKALEGGASVRTRSESAGALGDVETR